MTSASKLLMVLAVVGLFVSMGVSSSKPGDYDLLLRNDEPAANKLRLIAGYRHWTQVNTEPHLVGSQLAALCAAPVANQISREKQNPHLNKFVLVYVNDIGKTAMMEQKVSVFPEGSVIVKEKLTSKDSASPELLTVMRKREPGCDPDKGNWEYMVFDGPGQTLQASGVLENCQGCHIQHRATDYVSRAYLPGKVWENLR
jgi:hypothetical protein